MKFVTSISVVFLCVTTVFSAAVHAALDKYIVVFRPGTRDDVIDDHLLFLRELYAYANMQADDLDWISYDDANTGLPVRAYVTRIHPYVLEDLSMDPNVEFIEKDGVMHTMEHVALTDVQHNVDWGLSRISHRELSGSTDYMYHAEDGEGTDVYIIDTGINIHHVDFEGRAEWGITIPEGSQDNDLNGHGTHVGGVIGSKTYGVSKRARLIAVKVLTDQGYGSTSDVLRGMEWVVSQHKNGKKAKSVANMSLGGGYSKAMNRMADSMVAAGVHLAVAAGNESGNACDVSPASSKKAITVAASDYVDRRASFSNWGSCVNIFAPGHQIRSTWNVGDNSTMILSGTSMASPFVAGVMSVMLSRKGGSLLTPVLMRKLLEKLATKDVLKDVKESPNLLAFTDPPNSLYYPLVKQE